MPSHRLEVGVDCDNYAHSFYEAQQLSLSDPDNVGEESEKRTKFEITGSVWIFFAAKSRHSFEAIDSISSVRLSRNIKSSAVTK